MSSIFILGYNHLGADFWEQHLQISPYEKLLFFRDGKTLLNHLNKKPDVIIVDCYFCKEEHDEFGFSDLKVGLALRSPYTPTFFLSPKHRNEARKSVKYNHYYSNFNSSILECATNELNKLRKRIKTA